MDLTTTITALLTLAIFSFLYGDNPLYKFAERLLVGLSVGYSVAITVQSTLIERVWTPVVESGDWASLAPLGVGLLLFTRFVTQARRLTAIPLAVMIGAGAGAAIPAMLKARILTQLSDMVAKIHESSGAQDTIGAVILLVGFLTGLAFFYFGKRATKVHARLAGVGGLFLMIYFGATFGYTVMSRMSILIGRLDFLLRDWLQIIG